MHDASESTFSKISLHSSTDVSSQLFTGDILSNSVSLINLFNVIFTRLHPLFSIDCGAILVYDEQITVIREAYISTCISGTSEIHTETINQPSELSALQKNIAEFSFPVIKSIDEWQEEEGQNHCLVNGEAHYKYHCYIPLEKGNKILGTLELHNNSGEFSAECLTFCSSIADLLSDIFYLPHAQLITPDNQYASSGNNDQEQISKGRPKSAVNPHLLSKLAERVTQINETNSLDDFFNHAGKLFPRAYKKIKAQLDEINAFIRQKEDEALYIPQEDTALHNYPEIIGAGPKMRKVFALMDQVAPSASSVLIMGETGTGKELIAKAIHKASTRRDRVMISVNCAAIPANLIESELFGHEKGAFTGATDRRIGKFELADNGTLFLDEIGELPLDLQVKLLRVLQEKEIERVGGKATIKTDVRIISATNKDLLTEVEQGRFRRDLYYRLNVFPINLPPLRDRVEDIPLLAAYFLNKYGNKLTGFAQKAIKQMTNYSWPGNVREMEHLIERQILLSTKPVIREINIPTILKTIADSEGAPQKIKTIEENERDHIFAVLQICNGRISGEQGAAKLLGVPATTLNSKIKKLGLNKKHF
ncbi:sigma-54-dependent Fis family transcriptional regulator [Mucilaginibacter pocheonensis]|uniref:Transcriptional regulator with GAF, ATPase, and Fis domain n=1 Tax=Mucilaginibacter pocheonensis TaxID=398050 RepID=A0ABU1TER1_9SPHI|nr:sigma-54-dependent Fis family transcriptional regulator [Mucilaginibacter pocheonensis]MDR6943887.1 transcriptional regulator with GAF, ATPase, and Fis domain [Mucilaginibacter pocheonensis]